MKVAVRLFAAGREIAGTSEALVELGPAPCVADLRRALAERYPALGPLVGRSLLAINAEYADDATALAADDDVALIPPVSGG